MLNQSNCWSSKVGQFMLVTFSIMSITFSKLSSTSVTKIGYINFGDGYCRQQKFVTIIKFWHRFRHRFSGTDFFVTDIIFYIGSCVLVVMYKILCVNSQDLIQEKCLWKMFVRKRNLEFLPLIIAHFKIYRIHSCFCFSKLFLKYLNAGQLNLASGQMARIRPLWFWFDLILYAALSHE